MEIAEGVETAIFGQLCPYVEVWISWLTSDDNSRLHRSGTRWNICVEPLKKRLGNPIQKTKTGSRFS